MIKVDLWIKINENAPKHIHDNIDEYFDCACDSGDWHSYTGGNIYINIYDDCFINDFMEFLLENNFREYVRLGLKNRDC